MSQLPDQHAREAALNPQYSYIVQAPAGSGKTELLTQRFLKLLSCVEQPECILALTFTKKAAREMRHRILSTLEKAQSQPSETNQLAQEVLIQDKKYRWQLLTSPNRLRVQTIDSLCSSLAAKMPILSQGTPYASIVSDPKIYYDEAAKRCLEDEQPYYQKAIQTLLLHRGNHYGQCIALLSDMLSWREQWLPHIVPAEALSPNKLRTQLEQALKNLIHDAEAHLSTLFSTDSRKELEALIDFSEHNKPSGLSAFWKKVARLLLTQNYQWRSRVDKNLGFPSPSETKNPEEKEALKAMKNRLENLLSDFRAGFNKSESCRLALENYQHCPSDKYTHNQWDILQALLTLLPLLAGHLKTLFMETQTADFSEVAEKASHALGELGNPSELGLYMDYQIQHLLIDEFQDTSIKQFQLLEKLIDGWQEEDGHSLFIVGDPMQSIYRFREADVSLFLKVRESGIGQIRLKPLALCCNFRSHPELVTWINTCFHTIFPPQNDVHLGAVTHHASEAGRDKYLSSGEISFYVSETAQQQAQQIITQIQKIPANENIAILVRSRSQLTDIIAALQSAEMTFQGLDIDKLSTSVGIQDLLSLTQTLLQPANRLAWLATLRAPWCGLTSADLLLISQNSSYEDGENCLSQEAQKRFNFVKMVIEQARQQRQKQSLAVWVEKTWRQLHGHLCINPKDQKNIEQFWVLLDQYAYEDSDIPHKLLNKIKTLYANTPQESRLQIMTIHKSKGLEFDHIILPHLESSSSKKDVSLLQHLERQNGQNSTDLLLAAMQSIEVEQDPIYQYLQYLDHKKNIFEHQRLLYVALTRARKNIHLFAVQTQVPLSPAAFNYSPGIETGTSHSFLHGLKPYLPPAQIWKDDETLAQNMSFQSKATCLQRLPLHYFESHTQFPSTTNHAPLSKESSSSRALRIIGTFIHEKIQEYAETTTLNAPFNPDHVRSIAQNHDKKRLAELGLYTDAEQAQALDYTYLALNNMCQDPQGQWILAPHTDAKNEYSLSYLNADNELKTAILDRTFVEVNSTGSLRWIIDYKISFNHQSTGELSDHFAQYQSQLEHYAKLFMSISQVPIHLGLYYPLTQTWIAWQYIPVLE